MRQCGPAVLPLLVAILLTSCSFAPDRASATGRPAEFPDMRLEQTEYLFGMENNEPILIKAAVIELYRDADQAYITDATFTQHDAQEVLLISGTAGKAIIDTRTNDTRMSRGVVIKNHLDDVEIIAEELEWLDKEHVAQSGPDTLVTLILGEHDILRGRGFRGDFTTATYEFMSIEEGVLQYD